MNLRLVATLAVLAAMAGPPLAAQDIEGYVGPETSVEPQPGGQSKSGRYGGGWSGDWRFCAEEGERCSVRGWGVVRYGVRGRYVYREVRDARFWCDNRTFGDPARNQVKACEVRLFGDAGWGGGDDRGWTFCARENGTCRVDGPATVRFGIDGRFTERRVRGGTIFCGVGTFGDPAPNRRKICEVRYGRNDGGWGGDWGGDWGRGWTLCAREDETCRLPGPATVRYGTERRFVDRDIRGGSVRCDNRTFGDPAPGEVKFCAFRAHGWSGDGGWGGGGGDWRECAREGGFCRFNGRRAVWYGADNGRAVVQEFRNGVPCTNEAFRTDPAPGERKRCAIGRD